MYLLIGVKPASIKAFLVVFISLILWYATANPDPLAYDRSSQFQLDSKAGEDLFESDLEY